MKKRLSAYWWCQISGWSAYMLLATCSYTRLPHFPFWQTLFSMFLAGMIGLCITHLVRLLIVKFKLLQQKIIRQIISLIFISLVFSFFEASIMISLTKVFKFGEELISLYTHEFKINGFLMLTYSNFFFISIWNLVYVSYHYVQKSKKDQIEKIYLENELRVQKLESEKQLVELEMQTLRARMNPHFIFNSLNSIDLFILQNDKTKASKYLTKFSRLIRMILNSSSNASVCLAEDLEALQLYLELERLRCEEKFSFKIKIDPGLDIDFIQVPPMLLQPFAENAIWHGLMNKEDEGHLLINIREEDSTLICTITDDGIGRKKAAELKNKSGKHKSMGIKITEGRIAMMQKMNRENKSIEIKDLVDEEGCAAGTEVILKIPFIQ